jgi:hypothetical protein
MLISAAAAHQSIFLLSDRCLVCLHCLLA